MTNIDHQSAIKQLAEYINEANIVCFYGGAGTSTESGIPDYRSKHGIWTMMEENEQNPLYFANAKRIKEDPAAFFNRRKRTGPRPEPNIGHLVLANLEKQGKDIRIITQNVDGMHQLAGHRFVLELHGNHRTWYCMECGRIYKRDEVEYDQYGVPRCYVDSGIVRPNVVYFGENAKRETVEKSKHTLKVSDLLIIAGTSLSTPLATRLIQLFEGKHVVVINRDPLDIQPLHTDLFIQRSVGEVLKEVQPYIHTNIKKFTKKQERD